MLALLFITSAALALEPIPGPSPDTRYFLELSAPLSAYVRATHGFSGSEITQGDGCALDSAVNGSLACGPRSCADATVICAFRFEGQAGLTLPDVAFLSADPDLPR